MLFSTRATSSASSGDDLAMNKILAPQELACDELGDERGDERGDEAWTQNSDSGRLHSAVG